MIDYGTVSILMGTFNGEKYIKKQLESIRDQTYDNWILYISDDGSADSTLDIIHSFAGTLPPGKIKLFKGPGKGFARNFLSLLQRKEIKSVYYAFSDQDDIWLKNKLEVSVKKVHDLAGPGNDCVLYGGRTKLVDNNLKATGLSPLFIRRFSFNNALIQSYSGGNTMVFTHALKMLTEKIPDDITIVSHDWFLYALCSGVGGKIYYDCEPLVLYRQHENNLVGSNNSFYSKIIRLKHLLNGEFKKWTAINDQALRLYESDLTQANLRVLENFRQCSSASMSTRVKSFLAARCYRQNKLETVIFLLMSMLNKLK